MLISLISILTWKKSFIMSSIQHWQCILLMQTTAENEIIVCFNFSSHNYPGLVVCFCQWPGHLHWYNKTKQRSSSLSKQCRFEWNYYHWIRCNMLKQCFSTFFTSRNLLKISYHLAEPLGSAEPRLKNTVLKEQVQYFLEKV